MLAIELNLCCNDVTSQLFTPNNSLCYSTTIPHSIGQMRQQNNINHNGQKVIYLCFIEFRTSVTTPMASSSNTLTSLLHHSMTVDYRLEVIMEIIIIMVAMREFP
jgi:hypothetical protein